VCCNLLQYGSVNGCVTVVLCCDVDMVVLCCSMLQCVAVCCSMLQCGSVNGCVAVVLCCSVLP